MLNRRHGRLTALMLLTALSSLTALTAPHAARAADPPAKDPKDNPVIRVTLVVILASTSDKEINPKLKDLAEEIQKRHEHLVGFRLESVHQKSIPPGDTHKFEILDERTVAVKIERGRDKNGRVDLTVTPPGMEAISYTCVCDKFFPVVTPHKTKRGEQMIIAVLVKPCTGKGP